MKIVINFFLGKWWILINPMSTFQCRSCLKLNHVEADHRFIHGSHFRSIEGFAFFHPNFTVFQNLTKILGWVGGFTHLGKLSKKIFFYAFPICQSNRKSILGILFLTHLTSSHQKKSVNLFVSDTYDFYNYLWCSNQTVVQEFGSCLEIVRPLDHNAVVGPSQRRGLPPIMQSAQEHAAVWHGRDLHTFGWEEIHTQTSRRDNQKHVKCTSLLNCLSMKK